MLPDRQTQLEHKCFTIGILEDDPIMGESLVQRLIIEGYKPVWWKTGKDALKAFEKSTPDVLICDIQLSDMTGEEVFNQAQHALESTPVLFVTAFGNIEQAVRLIRKGADEYLTKPFEMEDLLNRIDSITCGQQETIQTGQSTLGVSSSMKAVEQILIRVADVDSNVMITGESGAGKEVAARFLHTHSNALEHPFMSVNCAAIPSYLMESELFGHLRGAFTGAEKNHSGYAARAGEGTLFLDEIGDMPVNLQGKLLHLIQQKTFTPVGGEQPQEFKARIVCATNRNLEQDVADKKFREDLYYRINVIPVRIPSLRERSEDILPLIKGYITHFSEQFGRAEMALSTAAEEAVLAYDWPGNVRELQNRIERVMAIVNDSTIKAQNLFPDSTHGGDDNEIPTLQSVRDASERRHIRRVLETTLGHIGEAAQVLGVSRTTLWEKMKKFEI